MVDLAADAPSSAVTALLNLTNASTSWLSLTSQALQALNPDYTVSGVISVVNFSASATPAPSTPAPSGTGGGLSCSPTCIVVPIVVVVVLAAVVAIAVSRHRSAQATNSVSRGNEREQNAQLLNVPLQEVPAKPRPPLDF